MNPPQAPLSVVAAAALVAWRKKYGPQAELPDLYEVGVRGYRRDTMGAAGRNDVGIYDDALFLVSNGKMIAVNGNTDPSAEGWNPGVGKPYAVLQPGVWWFRKGPHKGKTPALRQCTDEEAAALGVPDDGEFTVLRSWGRGDPRNYLETGYYAINQHPGGENGTSSWGCQTVVKKLAEWFFQSVWDAMAVHKTKIIPYILIEGPIC